MITNEQLAHGDKKESKATLLYPSSSASWCCYQTVLAEKMKKILYGGNVFATAEKIFARKFAERITENLIPAENKI